jgi:hypothetical protein
MDNIPQSIFWKDRSCVYLWCNQNFACCFVVWAEYFALGAKPAGIRVILPSFAYATALTALTLFAIPAFRFLPSVVEPGDLAAALVIGAGVAVMVFTMRFAKVFQVGSLPFFNGISMALAIYFSGSYPKLGPDLTAPLVAGVWTIAMGAFGAVLGVFNVWLTFPQEQQ